MVPRSGAASSGRVLLNVLDRVLLDVFEPITGPSVRPVRTINSARLRSALDKRVTLLKGSRIREGVLDSIRDLGFEYEYTVTTNFSNTKFLKSFN